jgi:phosphatidate cytidylyltransferase
MAQRIITGVVLLAALVLLLFLGGWVFAAVACLAFLKALHEELRALEMGGHKPLHWVSYASLLISVPFVMIYSYMAIMPILTLFSFVALLLIMRRQEPDLVDVIMSVLPMLTVVLPGMCVFGIAATQPRSMQLFLLALLFIIAIGGDTLAFFVGSRIGGQKLCPRISPKKTVAGALGGLVGSTLLAMLVGYAFQKALPNASFPPFWANLVIGVVGGIAGQAGDLFASMVKRHCDIKDFGNWLPGHGGILDRLDSIVFTAIIVYCYRVILL